MYVAETWKKVYIPSGFIKTRTDKAVLINMPRSSKFAGFSFWHPAKLVRSGWLNEVSVSYTKSFVFRLKMYGKGKYNSHEVIETKDISARDLAEAFRHTTNDDLVPDEPEIYVPEPLEPEGTEVDESLIDYD